jgi:hypothetical protein
MEILLWPGVALLLGILFIFLFRHQIGEKIKCITKFNKSGVTFLSSEDKKAVQVSTRDISDLFGSNDSRLLNEVEDFVRRDLAGNIFNSDQEKTDYLIRHLALSQLYLTFEQCYSLIFGSQIYLLKNLNEALGEGRDINFIRDYFVLVQSQFSPSFDGWSCDTYMQYLFHNKLATQKDDRVHITVRGIGFLVWLTKSGRSENKTY